MENKNELLERMLSRVGDLGFRRRIVTLLEYIDIKDGEKVLDLGCGEGFYTMVISELYDAEVTAFDFNATLLEKAAAWTGGGKRVEFVNGDIAETLPFEDNAFDKIVFTEVLEHIDDDRKAISEVYRVLKPGGVLGLTVPNANYPFFWDPLNWTRERVGLGHFSARNTVLGGVWSYDHKRLYSPGEIKKLAEETGFRTLRVETLTHHCVPFNYHVLRLGKLFYTMLPVPKEMKNSMEKFKWREEEKGSAFSPVNAAFNIFKRIDTRNDGPNGTERSSVSISLKLVK